MSSEQRIEQLLDMLKWNTAALVAILDHHGGTVRIEKELLESINLNSRAVRIGFDDEHGNYIIESGDIDAVQ